MNANLSIASPRPIDILLVDDDAGDALIAKKALESGRILNSIYSVRDGVEALEHLRNAQMPRPGLVLLDLNMPRMDGRELLAEMKKDPELQTIPVVIFTTSDSDQDVVSMYNLHASCYVTKPLDFEQFTKIVKEIKDSWFSVVKLP